MKTLLFRSFQSIQETRMTHVSRSFLACKGRLPRAESQYCWKEDCPIGTAPGKPTRVRKSAQTWEVTAQPARRWSMVSWECPQKTQMPWFGRPRRWRRSAVQQRRWTANHTKNLHFRGALVCQIAFALGSSHEPKKKAL